MDNFENEEYIRRLLLAQMQQEQQNQNYTPFEKTKAAASRLSTYGNYLSKTGKLLNRINNTKAQAIGSKMANFGNNIANKANMVSKTLNAPQYYMNGFKNYAIGNGLQNAGGYLAQNQGLIGKLGTGLQNYGSNMAAKAPAVFSNLGGNAAASTVGGAAAGTTAGTAAAGTGAAAGGAAAGTAAGSAAGGAAAGGSAGGAAFAGGPIGPLIGLGIMAVQGTNRKRSKQAGQGLMQNDLKELAQNANEMNVDSAPIQEVNNVNPIYENALNNSYNGITGGAAPLQGQVSQNNIQAPSAVAQQAQLPISTPEPQQTQQAAPQQQSFLSKLASGLGDFSRGYQENLNNSFNPNNLTANQFTETVAPNNDLLTKYQAQLTNQGYAPEVVNAVAEKKNSGYTDIDKWVKNNPDAYATTNTYDKGKMARLGEVVGSLARFSQKPGVQALIAGGLSTALTGNPLYGLGQAYKFGNQRAKNNIYEQALQQYGIDANTGFFGNIGPQDLNSIGNLYYKDLLDKYRQNQLEEMKLYHQGTLEQRARANDIREKQGNEKNRIAAIKAANKGGSGTKANKQAYTKTFNKDLADYSTLTPEQQKKVRPKMIEAYGKDFLSQESKFSSKKDEKKYTAPGL